MRIEKNRNSLAYPEEAFFAFNEIIVHSRKDMLESISRANKGELFVLHFLAKRGEKVLPSELSAALRVSTARISALLGALEKKGQIVREIDKDNRRNILVTITENGQNRVNMEMSETKNSMTRAFSDMGKVDTTEFIRLTRRFVDLMQTHMSKEAGDLNNG